MKPNVYQKSDVADILGKVFSFLVKQGLENASIREICKGTGIVQGSLYYWFSDKTTIICEATEHGLKKVTDEIFAYVFASIDDLPRFFVTCLDEIGRYQKELRFIYQMVASPKYGERLRHDGKYFKAMYDEYAKRLAAHLHYDIQTVKPVVYLLVSAILDYAVWDDRENSQAEIDFIASILPTVLTSDQASKGR